MRLSDGLGCSMEVRKDCWDKLEIVAKILGATVIPLTVGFAAYWLNDQISQRSRSAEMTSIAVGILTTPPSNSEYSEDERALRTWAVGILENPSGDNALSAELKRILINDRFTIGWSDVFSSIDDSEIESYTQRLQEINEALRTSPLLLQPDGAQADGVNR